MSGPAYSSVSFDRLADIYDATRGGLARGRDVAADIAGWIGRGPRPVVEIGVGTRVVATALREDHGHRIVGVDLSPNMAAVARERLGPVVAVGDAARLPLPDARVDTVVCVWVLHLVGNVHAVLAEIGRVLRPGGRLVVVAGNPTSRPDDITEAVGDFLRPVRRPGYDVRVVEQAAHQAGFVLCARGTTTEQEWDQSPNGEADRIEQRTYGPLVDLDDETFERLACPVVDRLRALPDPDTPRHRGRWHRILVFDHP